MLPSSFGCGLGLRGLHFRGHLCVHSRYGPVTRRPPFYDGRVDGLQGISFLPPCHPNYGVLALSPAGLSPAERASLCWTHNRACGFPAPGSRTRSCLRPRKTRRSLRKAGKAHVVPQALIREPHVLPGPYLVLAAQPLAQPPDRMLVDSLVGRTALSQLKVIHPAGHRPVQASHYRSLVE